MFSLFKHIDIDCVYQLKTSSIFLPVLMYISWLSSAALSVSDYHAQTGTCPTLHIQNMYPVCIQ